MSSCLGSFAYAIPSSDSIPCQTPTWAGVAFSTFESVSRDSRPAHPAPKSGPYPELPSPGLSLHRQEPYSLAAGAALLSAYSQHTTWH